jgi:hypothetical protein
MVLPQFHLNLIETFAAGGMSRTVVSLCLPTTHDGIDIERVKL